jgi:hypothetical protein
MRAGVSALSVAAMEWIAVVVWFMIVNLSLPLAFRAITTAWGGPTALAAFTGFALCALFIILGGSQLVAWGTVAFGVLGVVAAGLAAAWLTSSERAVSPAGQASEELQATMAGVLVPLFAVVTVLSLGMALGLSVA